MSTTPFAPPLVPPTTLGASTRTFTYDGVSVGTSNGRDTMCTVDDIDPIESWSAVASARVAYLRAHLPAGVFSDALCEWEWGRTFGDAMCEWEWDHALRISEGVAEGDYWWRDLVRVQVCRVMPDESAAMGEQRAEVLCGLVMQLCVAMEAGAGITVGAVINVARAAFPRDLRGEALREAAIAGMCVMWANYPGWVESVAGEFDAALDAAGRWWSVWRPDSIARDSRMTRGEHGARRIAADNAVIDTGHPFRDIGAMFAPQPAYPFGTSR